MNKRGCSEEDAKKFLQYNNYYFKLKSYARNYNMNSQTKKYFSLDFAYLVELSRLDMYIRKIILEIIFLETNKSKKAHFTGVTEGVESCRMCWISNSMQHEYK